jgi:ribonuclease HII
LKSAEFPNYELESEFTAEGIYVAGADEAGRGPLAGPVTVSVVVLPVGLKIEGLNDSKKLGETKREDLYSIIIEKALDYSIVSVDNNTIDEINILKATMMAFENAVNDIKLKLNMLLLDGNYSTIKSVPVTTVVKGDSKSCSIAAASILAKVTRDRFMVNVANKDFPEYGFDKHKGYATKLHIERIKEFGPCPLHRLTFLKNLFQPEQLKLF